MKTTLLTALRSETRSWWYHAQLRRQGNLTEARVRENRSIRDNLDVIRKAKLATIGKGGSTIYLGNGARQTAGWEMSIIQHLACPVVDLRVMPHDTLVEFAIKGPMVNVDISEDEGTNAFDYVTIDTYIRLARAGGAEVRNVD